MDAVHGSPYKPAMCNYLSACPMDLPIVSYLCNYTAIVSPYCQLTPMENYMNIRTYM